MRPVGQVVKTEASHAFNIGSNPVRVTTSFLQEKNSLDIMARKRYNPEVTGESL